MPWKVLIALACAFLVAGIVYYGVSLGENVSKTGQGVIPSNLSN